MEAFKHHFLRASGAPLLYPHPGYNEVSYIVNNCPRRIPPVFFFFFFFLTLFPLIPENSVKEFFT